MSYAPGLVVGRLFDLGYLRLPVFASSVFFSACMFLTAECKQYWQFLLCQGFGVGVSLQFASAFRFQDLTLGLPADCMRGVLQHRKHGTHPLVQAKARFGTCHCLRWDKRLWMYLPCRHEGSTPAYEVRKCQTSLLFAAPHTYSSFAWTMRILAFITLVLLAPANLVR